MTGDELRALRESRSVTQTELARTLEIGQNAISAYERAGRGLSVDKVQRATDYLESLPDLSPERFDQRRLLALYAGTDLRPSDVYRAIGAPTSSELAWRRGERAIPRRYLEALKAIESTPDPVAAAKRMQLERPVATKPTRKRKRPTDDNRMEPNALRALRESRGLSQTGLARATGINASAISQYERGIPSMSAQRVQIVVARLQALPDVSTNRISREQLNAFLDQDGIEPAVVWKALGIPKRVLWQWRRGKEVIARKHMSALLRLVNSHDPHMTSQLMQTEQLAQQRGHDQLARDLTALGQSFDADVDRS